jgi:hypothetical protein
MTRSVYLASAALLAASFVGHGGAAAQQRRSASPPPGAAALPSARGAVDARFPYAGAWEGDRTMRVPDDGQTDRLRIVFKVTDSARVSYDGAIFHQDGSRAPFVNATLSDAGLTWEQANSGGGKWIYKAALVSPDSIIGTLVLRGAPWTPAKEPSGTFSLTRKP